MRIVARSSGLLSLLVGVGLFLGCGQPAIAQEASLPTVSSPSMAQADAAKTAPVADTQGIAIKGGDALMGNSSDTSGVPPSVKSVMKKFNDTKMKITLGDLNEGREALARLDMMIELEKRVADLEKVRADREKDRQDAMNGFSPIPSGALSMPPSRAVALPAAADSGIGMPTPPPARSQRVPVAATDIVVEKVFGSNGKYKALVKVFETPSTVSVGDELSSGDVVRSISSRGIVIVSGGKEKKIDIKNVGMVAGAL